MCKRISHWNDLCLDRDSCLRTSLQQQHIYIKQLFFKRSGDEMSNHFSIQWVQMKSREIGWLSIKDQTQGSLLFRTHNGAEQWNAITPSGIQIKSIFPFGKHIAWIYGMNEKAVVLHTTNGGERWEQYEVPVSEEWEKKESVKVRMEFINATHGWLLVTGKGENQQSLYHTENSGKSWRPLRSTSLPSNISGMKFVSKKNGWVTLHDELARNLVYRTMDGGVSWQQVRFFTLDRPGMYHARKPLFIDNMLIIPIEESIGGIYRIMIYSSPDLGRTWKVSRMIPSKQGVSLSFSSLHRGWIVDGEMGVLYRSKQRMQKWDLWEYDEKLKGARGLHFYSVTEGWACTNTALLYTKNGGKTWRTKKLHIM